VNTAKQHLRFQEGSLAIDWLTWSMLRYQQFVGSFLAQHLDSHQHWRNHNRMKSVHADRFDRMQIFDRLTIFLGEGHVSPKVSNRPARPHSAYHIAFRQVLVFQTYRGLHKDSSFFQHPQRLPRKSKSDLVKRSLLLHASINLPFLCVTPNANRTSEGRADHLLGTTGPAVVKARVFDQDGQVVSTPVVP